MAFKQSYLVPKHLYEILCNPTQISSKEPPDVRMKKLDHAYRFQMEVEDEEEHPKKIILKPDKDTLSHRKDIILKAVKDDSKRYLASQILKFFHEKGGGSVKFEDDFKVAVDGERIPGLDARDALRYLVGEIEDSDLKAFPLYQKLKTLKARDHLSRFYWQPDKKKWLFYTPYAKQHSWESEDASDVGSQAEEGISTPESQTLSQYFSPTSEKETPIYRERSPDSDTEKPAYRGRSTEPQKRKTRKRREHHMLTRRQIGSTRSGKQWQTYK